MVVVAAQADGAEGMSDKMEQFLADQLEAGRVLDAVIAQSEAQARNMWTIRESVAPGVARRGPGPQLRHLGVDLEDPGLHRAGLKAALDILPRSAPTRSAISATATCTSPSWDRRAWTARR